MTETSASTPSLAEAKLPSDADRNDVANEPNLPRAVAEEIIAGAEPPPITSRQRSRSISSQSSLSELSELSDLPDNEMDSNADSLAKRDAANGSAMDVDGVMPDASSSTSTRIRKRTYDSDSDYLLPSLKKQTRLPSALANKGRNASKSTLPATPTESDLSSVSHENVEQARIKEMNALEEEQEQDEEDDAEPDEDEERDERLASLRGTNGSTAVGRWIDPYPDGTLGKPKTDRKPTHTLIPSSFP